MSYIAVGGAGGYTIRLFLSVGGREAGRADGDFRAGWVTFSMGMFATGGTIFRDNVDVD